jgi:hypothetical protein
MKMKKTILFAAVLPLGLELLAQAARTEAAPATAVPTQQPATAAENNVSDDPIKFRIIDWQGMPLGSPSTPDWTIQVTLLNYNQAAINLGYSDALQAGGPLYRGWTITWPDLRGAENEADRSLERAIVHELTESAQFYVFGSSAMTEETKDMILTITRMMLAEKDTIRGGELTGLPQETQHEIRKLYESAIRVPIASYRQVGSFWQLIETEDGSAGTKTKVYVLYRLYRIDNQALAAMTAAYVQRILELLPTPLDQQEIQNMLTSMLQHARSSGERIKMTDGEWNNRSSPDLIPW